MMVFFQIRLGKILIWQKLSQTLECAFKQLAILKSTSQQLLLTRFLNSKNLLTSYEQLSYYQLNIKQIKTYEIVFHKEKSVYVLILF